MVYCCRCIAKEHRSCSDVKEIEDVAHKSNMSTLQSLVAEITRVSPQLHTTKLEMANDHKLIQKMKACLLKKIKGLRKQFNQHLDTLEQKIIAKLDEEQNKLEKELCDDITAVDNWIIATDQNKPDMKSHFDEKQIFITEKLSQTVLANANNFLKKANLLKHPTLTFEPNDILCGAIHKSDCMGKINRIHSKPVRIQRSNYTVKYVNDLNLSVSSDKERCYIIGMCQLPDDTILLIDHNNNKLKRLDDKLNVKDFLDLKAALTGLCSVSPTEVAARMQDNTIQFISVGKSLSYQRKVSINNFNAANDGMVCCNNQLWIPGDEAVHIHSLSGTLVKKIRTDSRGRKIFPEYNPQHMAVSDDDKVYVTAWQIRVVVFNSNGDVIKELRDQRLDRTCGICITEDDIVLVAGYNSKNVVMFDRDDKCLGELVSSKDMLSNPCSLCYDRKKCRLIVEYWLNNVHIFQLT